MQIQRVTSHFIIKTWHSFEFVRSVSVDDESSGLLFIGYWWHSSYCLVKTSFLINPLWQNILTKH